MFSSDFFFRLSNRIQIKDPHRYIDVFHLMVVILYLHGVRLYFKANIDIIRCHFRAFLRLLTSSPDLPMQIYASGLAYASTSAIQYLHSQLCTGVRLRKQ